MTDRRITVRLVSWGEVSRNTQEGYAETFRRGAFDGAIPSEVVVESQRHDGTVVGVAESIVQRGADAIATFRIAATQAGDELLTLVRDGVLSRASILFSPREHVDRPDGVVERTAVDLKRVAILPRGAYPSARVLRAEADGLRSVEGELMPAPITDPITDPIADPPVVELAREEVMPAPIIQTVDLDPVLGRLEAIETDVSALRAHAAAPAPAHDLARFESFGDFIMAAYDEPELARDWTTNVTGDNDGVMSGGPSWLPDIKRIVAQSRAAITAFGGAKALTETGMQVNWPIAPNGTYVGVQATQGTEVLSSQIDIDDANAAVVTYAGGAGISYQLLKRSTPSYRDAILRIILGSWAQVTTGAFAAALVSGAGKAIATRQCFGAAKQLATSAHADDIIDVTAHGFSIGQPVVFTAKGGGDTTFPILGRVYWVTAVSHAANTFRVSETPGGAPVEWGTADLTDATYVAGLIDTTGAGYRALLFEASAAVQQVTGAPGLAVVASTDQFLMLAGFTGLYPSQYGTQNVSGIADAASLKVNINGLDVIHEPHLAAGNVIVGNDIAAAFMEDGPHPITQEVARTLSQDSVIYSFGASGIFVPAGVAKLRAA